MRRHRCVQMIIERLHVCRVLIEGVAGRARILCVKIHLIVLAGLEIVASCEALIRIYELVVDAMLQRVGVLSLARSQQVVSMSISLRY